MVVAAGAEAENRSAGMHPYCDDNMLKRVKVGLIPSMGIFILVGLVGLRRRLKK
jgi:hypothetical protein